jgi:broad specificity phosphatase PhoE
VGRILLVRHAQASFGADDYDCLSEHGLKQAACLGRWLTRCNRKLDIVVTGAMQRHAQTAQATLEAMSPGLRPTQPAIVDAGFDEYDADHVVQCAWPQFKEPAAMRKHLSQHEQPRREFQRLFASAMLRWGSGEQDGDYHETWSAFRARCVAALERAVLAAEGRDVVVFTSGGPITAICAQLLQLPTARAFELNYVLANTGVTGLSAGRSGLTLRHVNNHAHLDESGAPEVTYR